MPRIRRRGHRLRDVELPVGDMSLADLGEELAIVREQQPGVTPGCKESWRLFLREIQLEDELEHRFSERRRTGPMTDAEIEKWADLKGVFDPHRERFIQQARGFWGWYSKHADKTAPVLMRRRI